MSYGSRVDGEGNPIVANGTAPVMVGERVVGNTILDFDFGKDFNSGELIKSRAVLAFRQANGAVFRVTFFDSDQDWAIDETNKKFAHIGTKIVSEADYYAAVEGSNNFEEFVTNIKTKVIPKAEGRTFSLKIVYKYRKTDGKWYPQLPKYPNFIEVDGTTPSTLSTNAKYDVYEIPAATDMATEGATAGADSETF